MFSGLSDCDRRAANNALDSNVSIVLFFEQGLRIMISKWRQDNRCITAGGRCGKPAPVSRTECRAIPALCGGSFRRVVAGGTAASGGEEMLGHLGSLTLPCPDMY